MTLHISEIAVKLSVGSKTAGTAPGRTSPGKAGGADAGGAARPVPANWMEECVERCADRVLALLRAMGER